MSARADDAKRVGSHPWLAYLEGHDASFPETALRRDIASVARKTAAFRADKTPPQKRLADNMLNQNPATIGTLTHLMQGGVVPGREGSLLFARLRYFDPEARCAGVPPDVAALISEMTETKTVVTLVNLSAKEPRSVIVQGGAYGEHRIQTVDVGGRSEKVNGRTFTVRLEPGAGGKFTLGMRRYSEPPTVTLPWERK